MSAVHRGSFVTILALIALMPAIADAQGLAGGDDPYRRYIATAPEFQNSLEPCRRYCRDDSQKIVEALDRELRDALVRRVGSSPDVVDGESRPQTRATAGSPGSSRHFVMTKLSTS